MMPNGSTTSAAQWYAAALGVQPYFRRPEQGAPAYIEFRVGSIEQELGIMNREYAPWAGDQPSGAIAYWHVDDLEPTLKRLIDAGATPLEPVTDRGEGFVTASVADPFGNILGVMTNPHFAERAGVS